MTKCCFGWIGAAFKEFQLKATVIQVEANHSNVDEPAMAGRLAAWFGRNLFRNEFWSGEGRDQSLNILPYNRLNPQLKTLIAEMLAERKAKVSA